MEARLAQAGTKDDWGQIMAIFPGHEHPTPRPDLAREAPVAASARRIRPRHLPTMLSGDGIDPFRVSKVGKSWLATCR